MKTKLKLTMMALLMSIAFGFQSFAQPDFVSHVWIFENGNIFPDLKCHTFVKLNQGGFVVVGDVPNTLFYPYDRVPILIQFDANLSVVNANMINADIGSYKTFDPQDIIETPTGFAIVGNFLGPIANPDYCCSGFILTVDNNLNFQSMTAYWNTAELYGVTQTDRGNYLLFGRSISDLVGDFIYKKMPLVLLVEQNAPHNIIQSYIFQDADTKDEGCFYDAVYYKQNSFAATGYITEDPTSTTIPYISRDLLLADIIVGWNGSQEYLDRVENMIFNNGTNDETGRAVYIHTDDEFFIASENYLKDQSVVYDTAISVLRVRDMGGWMNGDLNNMDYEFRLVTNQGPALFPRGISCISNLDNLVITGYQNDPLYIENTFVLQTESFFQNNTYCHVFNDTLERDYLFENRLFSDGKIISFGYAFPTNGSPWSIYIVGDEIGNTKPSCAERLPVDVQVEKPDRYVVHRYEHKDKELPYDFENYKITTKMKVDCGKIPTYNHKSAALGITENKPEEQVNFLYTEILIENYSGNYRIVNILGQEVASGKINGSGSISTTNLNTGIYFLQNIDSQR